MKPLTTTLAALALGIAAEGCAQMHEKDAVAYVKATEGWEDVRVVATYTDHPLCRQKFGTKFNQNYAYEVTGIDDYWSDYGFEMHALVCMGGLDLFGGEFRTAWKSEISWEAVE
ncbi:MAG TPA: hypothetical protein HA362_03400 [Nanoarchaeota archaeon]|nr:hypothetical protein [Nanoarchaeota archaeon]